MYDQKNDNLISRSDAQALILSHDGDCALLHLWMALTGSKDLEQAARDLCMTRACFLPEAYPYLLQQIPLLLQSLFFSRLTNCRFTQPLRLIPVSGKTAGIVLC